MCKVHDFDVKIGPLHTPSSKAARGSERNIGTPDPILRKSEKCGFRNVGVSSEKVLGFCGKVRGFPKQKPAIGKTLACA